MNSEDVVAADVLEDIQDVCYRAIHHAAFNTSDKMLAALVPLIDRAKAAELRRIADAQTARARGLSPRDNFVSVASLRARADELDPPTSKDT